MPQARIDDRRPGEGGYALIEVMISALIVVLVTGAVIQLLGSTGRAGAEQRHHSQAYAVAQEDQARLRAMRISDLQNELPPRTVVLNGTPYAVQSTATFVSDRTGTTKCGSEGRADYIRVGSQVTWPTMREGAEPVTIESIDSPVSGSVDPTSGGLAVTVKNGAGIPISGVGLTGSGPGSFAGSTNSEGCALFGGEPAGAYTLTPSLPDPSFIDFNGEAPSPTTVSIVGGTTTPVELQYDKAGSINVTFQVRKSSGTTTTEAATADSIIATATGMRAARTFAAPERKPAAAILATPLFPFSYTYNLYAGSCTTNQPESGSANVKAPSGGSTTAIVTLPALYLTVKNSKGTTAEQTAVSGARVTLTDPRCIVGSRPYQRSYLSNATGALAESATGPSRPGVPSATYEVCASKLIGAQQVKVVNPSVAVKSVNGTALSLDLGAGQIGECP